ARPGGKYRAAPPIVLNAPQAFRSNNACTEVRTRQLGRRLPGALERVVNRDVDRLERHAGAVEIEHGKAPVKGRSRRWIRPASSAARLPPHWPGARSCWRSRARA